MKLSLFKITAITASVLAMGAANIASAQPGSYYAPPQAFNEPPPGYNPNYNQAQGYQQQGYQQPGYQQQGNQQQRFAPNGYYPQNRYQNQNQNSFPPNFRQMPYFGNSNNRGPYPWQQFPYWRGGEDGPDVRWFSNTPKRWMNQGPKEGAGQVFDDFLDGPSRFGDMPGGWSAPSIAVPNPIDVEEELRKGSKDLIHFY